MQALQPIPIGWRVHTAPRHRSRTAVTHSIHMPKTQLRPNTLKCAHRTIRPRGSTQSGAHSCSHFPGRHARSKRTGSAPLGRQGQPARRPSTRSLPGSPRPLERQPATPRWFSRLDLRSGRLQGDLERSTPRKPKSSPIMMVTSAPSRRHHLALIGTARTPSAEKLHSTSEWEEQKRSTVQRRSALSTAL